MNSFAFSFRVFPNTNLLMARKSSVKASCHRATQCHLDWIQGRIHTGGRASISFEIREKWNGERGPEGLEKCIRRWAQETKQQIMHFYLESGGCSLIAGVPCNLLPSFEPPKNEAELQTRWSFHFRDKGPFDRWFYGGLISDCFPSLILPWPQGLQAFPEPQQCLGHSICLATSSPGNQKESIVFIQMRLLARGCSSNSSPSHILFPSLKQEEYNVPDIIFINKFIYGLFSI